MKRAWKTQDIEWGEGIQTAIDMTVLLMNESHRLWYPVHGHRPLSPPCFLPTFATCFAVGTEIMAFELRELSTSLHRLEFTQLGLK